MQVEGDPGSKNDASRVCDGSKSSQGLMASVSQLCRLLGFEFSEWIIAEEMAAEVVRWSRRRWPQRCAIEERMAPFLHRFLASSLRVRVY
jgi:hypothetical protein